MKTKITTFAVILLLCNFSVFGQGVTKENYEKAIDYMNCKTVEYSLRLSQTKGVAESFQDRIDCKKSPNSSQVKESIPLSEQESINLSSEIDKIKTDDSFQPTDEQIIIKYLSSDVFTEPGKEKFPALYDFAVKYSNSRKDARNVEFVPIKRLKDLLAAELKALFADLKFSGNTSVSNSPIANVQKNTNAARNSNTSQNMSTDDGFFTFANLIYAIPILLSIIAILMSALTFWVLSKDIKFLTESMQRKVLGEKKAISAPQPKALLNLEDRLKNLENKMQETFSNRNLAIQRPEIKSATPVSVSEIDKLKNEINELKKEVELKADLRGRLEELKKEVESLKIKVREDGLIPDTNVYMATPPPFREEPPKEIFYSPKPNNEGDFNVASLQPVFKDGESVYKFTKTSNTKASFMVDDRDSAMQIALRFSEAIIGPACSAQNSFGGSEKRIVTVKPGEAVLEGDSWKIIKKALIRYEH